MQQLALFVQSCPACLSVTAVLKRPLVSTLFMRYNVHVIGAGRVLARWQPRFLREYKRKRGVMVMTNVELLGLIIGIASLILSVAALIKNK